MIFCLFLTYLTLICFYVGVLITIYGKWALNDNYFFNGIFASIFSLFLFAMTFCLGDTSSSWEITNYCSLSRQLVEKEDKNNKIQIINLEFEGLIAQITDKKEIDLFIKNPSRYHFFLKTQFGIFIQRQENLIYYSIDKPKNKSLL